MLAQGGLRRALDDVVDRLPLHVNLLVPRGVATRSGNHRLLHHLRSTGQRRQTRRHRPRHRQTSPAQATNCAWRSPTPDPEARIPPEPGSPGSPTEPARSAANSPSDPPPPAHSSGRYCHASSTRRRLRTVPRRGLATLLRASDVTVTCESRDATELLHCVDNDPPDAVILDIRMPPTFTEEGIIAAEQLRQTHPGSRSCCYPPTPKPNTHCACSTAEPPAWDTC